VSGTKSISIIIPNYNGRHLLEEYLPYTQAAIENSGATFEIIIVDDCSKDDSVQFLKEHYPLIQLIINPENKGFSHSCNQGSKFAKGELIMFLNSDVKLSPDYFDRIWSYFEEPDTFGVMGQIMDMVGDGLQDTARMPAFNGFKIKTAWFFYSGNPNNKVYTFYLSGANAVINAAKLKAIGGFNEIFSPFYGEDFELGIRAWRLNWKCYYEHRAVCRHQVSASTKNYKTARWVKSIYYRNRFFVHAIHLDSLYRLLWYLQITLIDLLPKLIAGQWWIWNSYRQLFKNGKAITESRRRIKQLMLENDSTTSVADVVKRIKQYSQSIDIIRIKDRSAPQ
jgi:GT2 family glycosyltransferase